MKKLSLALGLYLTNLFLSGFVPLADEEGSSPLILWGVCILGVLILFLAILYALKQQRKTTETADQHGHASGGSVSGIAPSVAAQAPFAAGMFMEKEANNEFAVEEELAAAAPDNLELIEGIGPSIAGILQAAGIHTFSQLAEADPGQIKDILTEAGMGNLADPTSWGRQAGLAAEGKFDELAALQNELKAGRDQE